MLIARRAGFSLIELLVSVTVLAVVMALAIPSFNSWIRNSRVRAVTDALQSSVRMAQAEAQRRSQTVAFFMTNTKACATTATAAAGGSYWQIRTVPNAMITGDGEVVQCGVLSDVSTGVTLTSSATAVCFSADGRQVSATNPAGIGVNCTAAATTYDVAPSVASTENRPLRVTVSLGGAIRLCDPGKSSSTPEGCR